MQNLPIILIIVTNTLVHVRPYMTHCVYCICDAGALSKIYTLLIYRGPFFCNTQKLLFILNNFSPSSIIMYVRIFEVQVYLSVFFK